MSLRSASRHNVSITDAQTREAPAEETVLQAPRKAEHHAIGTALGTAPTVVAIALLFVATWADGAFLVKSWAPLAVFALLAVAVGPHAGVRGAALAMAGLMAGLAGWALISTQWSAAPGRALEGGARDALYAALVALPLLTLPSRGAAVRIAQLLCAGSAVIVLGTLVSCLDDGVPHFLAGRLDDPVGYRNGSAALFALCFWPLVSVAAQRRAHPLVRGATFALAVTALGLAFLTQSRGVLIGFCCGAVVALALGPDRIRRAWLALLAVAAIAACSGTLLEPYDAFVASRTTDPAAVEHAVQTLAQVAVGGFVAALLLALVDGGLRLSAARQTTIRAIASTALAVLSIAVIAGGLLAVGNPVALARDKVTEFKQLDVGAPGETRLGSTGGQRYDLWRIAWADFRADPVNGAGEGAYPVRYYQERATDRNLSTPHSLPLEVLGQLGLVGALLLAGALVAAALALARGWPSATEAERRWASALAAGGAVLLGQSVVDWLWQIPGLTGLGLMCLATAVAIVSLPRRPNAGPAPGTVRRAAGITGRVAAGLAALLVAGVFLSDVYVRSARAADASSAQRLDRADTARRLNPLALPPRFQQAGALEELGRRGEARTTLREALDVEPKSFVTMALLGDLETRAGKMAAARAWYRKALALNPGDVGLQQLAR